MKKLIIEIPSKINVLKQSIQNLPPAENADSVLNDVSSSKILGKFPQLIPFLGAVHSGKGKNSGKDIAGQLTKKKRAFLYHNSHAWQ